MYSKDGKVYSDAYKYLKHKEKPIVGFSVPGDESDFEEKDIDFSTMVTDGDNITLNSCLRFIIGDHTHKGIKTKVVKTRYSNDDQLAVMLNGDEESLQRMQKWREFAEEVAERVCGGEE